jgi:hypothetical protein
LKGLPAREVLDEPRLEQVKKRLHCRGRQVVEAVELAEQRGHIARDTLADRLAHQGGERLGDAVAQVEEANGAGVREGLLDIGGEVRKRTVGCA